MAMQRKEREAGIYLSIETAPERRTVLDLLN